MLLYVNEHDNVRTIFTALSPLVATAVGWVFGREVHRKQAENATAFAQNATEEAMKGHRLAGAVKTAVDMANSTPGKSVDLAALSNLATTLLVPGEHFAAVTRYLNDNTVRGALRAVDVSKPVASGALGTFVLSDTAAAARSWEQTSRENKDYASYTDEDCYGIVGTQGSLSIPTMRLKRFAPGQKHSWYEPMTESIVEGQRHDPLALQLSHFCAVIRGEATPLVSARDGLQNLRVVEALAQAARSGAVVEVAAPR